MERVLGGCPKLKETVAVFPSFYWANISSYTDHKVPDRTISSLKSRLRNLNFFIICKSNHYFLIYARLRSKVIGFYDPKNLFRLFGLWNKVRDLFHLAGYKIDKWRQLEESHHPQGDSLNCGMFVIGRIFELIAFPECSQTKFLEKTMPQFRDWAFKVGTGKGHPVSTISDLFHEDGSPNFELKANDSPSFKTPVRRGRPSGLPIFVGID